MKDVKKDFGKINSVKEIAESKIKAANALADEHYYGKLTLFYDALRELLECVALVKGYKIYNHECYTYFLKEIIRESEKSDEFDSIRKIRNAVNYYGKELKPKQAEDLIKRIRNLRSFVLNIL